MIKKSIRVTLDGQDLPESAWIQEDPWELFPTPTIRQANPTGRGDIKIRIKRGRVSSEVWEKHPTLFEIFTYDYLEGF